VLKIPLIDVHAHLEELPDLPQALSEAKGEGVKAIIAVGMDLGSNKRTLEIAEGHRGYVYPALGYHPWEIHPDRIEENLSFIREHISECLALGEIGLDYKAKVKKELQWNVFGTLLDLACEHGRPAIIHCRYSHQRALEMVCERGVRKAVFHWYVGSLDLLERILEKGYLISATPALRYSPPHQQAIARTPLERILLETDTPVKVEGKETRPKDVSISLQEVARLKQLEPSVVAEQTTDNACHFFQIQHPSGLGS
jgi:TatD DNase family protein